MTRKIRSFSALRRGLMSTPRSSGLGRVAHFLTRRLEFENAALMLSARGTKISRARLGHRYIALLGR